jgi:hypothetical protein
MNLIIKTSSDLAQWFEQEPAPYYGERRTMLDDRTVDTVYHASELSLDYLFSQPHPDIEETESFDLNDFLNYH